MAERSDEQGKLTFTDYNQGRGSVSPRAARTCCFRKGGIMRESPDCAPSLASSGFFVAEHRGMLQSATRLASSPRTRTVKYKSALHCSLTAS